MRKDQTDFFSSIIDFINSLGLYPEVNTITGPSHSPEIIIGGRTYVTFCSNNYLGLAGDRRVKDAVIRGVNKYGVGSGSTRMLSGSTDVQVAFEEKLASFMDAPGAITFSSGYHANCGVIRMMADRFPYAAELPVSNNEGVIFSDEVNHASIIDAVRLSNSEKEVYRHNDPNDLERLLKKHRDKDCRKLIITDGVFSMDGDIADLKAIVELARRHDALLYVDDSHGTGVLGPNGEGTCHYLGLEKDVDAIMGSFTKAWGSIGGFVTLKNINAARYLRITARSYIFSDPILPSVIEGLIETLEIIRSGAALRKATTDNATYLRTQLVNLGFTVLGAEFMPIVPVIIGSEEKAIAFSERLYEAGIYAPPVRRPAVKEGMERLRLTAMATHTRGHIDRLIEVMESAGRGLSVI